MNEGEPPGAAAPAPRTRAERKARTRAALIEAAIDETIRVGPEGARVERIAAAAGCTTGALYAHFRSKDELILAVYDEATRRVSAETANLARAAGDPAARPAGSDAGAAAHATSRLRDEAVERDAAALRPPPLTAPVEPAGPADGRAALPALADAWLAWHRSDLRWFRLNAAFLLSLGDAPELRPAVGDRRREARRWFMRAAEAIAAERGRRLTIPAEELASLAYALGFGLLFEVAGDPDAPAAARFGDAVAALFDHYTEDLP